MNIFEDNENGEIEELAAQFKQASDNDISLYFDADDFEDIISYLLENGEFDYAKKALQSAVDQYPHNTYFYIQYAKYYALKMDFSEAKKKLDYIEQHCTIIPEFYVEKVLILHALNQPVEGIELLHKALALDEEMAEAHLLLAHEYLTVTDVDLAVKHALRAIQLDNLAAEDLKLVTIDFHEMFGQQKNILTDFYQRMTHEMPLCGSLWCGLGLTYITNGDFENAIEAFQFELSLDEEDSLAYVNLAEAYYGAEDYAQALEYFNIAQQKCSLLQFNIPIGRCYYQLKDYDSALWYFRQAKEDEPLYVELASDISKVLTMQGKFDEARSYLRAQWNKDPDNLSLIKELVDLLDPQNDQDELRALCFHVFNSKKIPKLPFLIFFVLHCCLSHGEDLGIEICSPLISDSEVCTDIYYFMAALYLKKGHIQQGCEFLETALQSDPYLYDFVFDIMDPDFQTIPEVMQLCRIYRNTEEDETNS